MSEQKTERKIPLWLAISGLIIVAGCLVTIVVLILYQMDYRRRAETTRIIAAQIYEDTIVPEGVVLLHQKQSDNPLVLFVDGCTGSDVMAVYGTNRPEEEIAEEYIHHFVEEEEYNTNWNQRSFFKGTQRSVYISFDVPPDILTSLSPEMESIANDLELFYLLDVAYSIPPRFNPDAECDLRSW